MKELAESATHQGFGLSSVAIVATLRALADDIEAQRIVVTDACGVCVLGHEDFPTAEFSLSFTRAKGRPA